MTALKLTIFINETLFFTIGDWLCDNRSHFQANIQYIMKY